jgi:hypothetical protein
MKHTGYPDLFDYFAARDSAMATVERNAGKDFKTQAMAFALRWMAGKGTVSGEDITDACKAAGIVPHCDKAFGPVYAGLARRGAIVRDGYAIRRRGHGAPAPAWRLS